MNYEEIYTEDYFSGRTSAFYRFGYGRFAKFYFDNLFRPIMPYLLGIKTGNVLDAGCAYGLLLQRVPDTLKKFGVDISSHAINQARKRLSTATLKVCNIEHALPFPADFFDAVIFSDVIEHLEFPSIALANISRALKKNGILYIVTPNLNWFRKIFFRHADEKEHHISLFAHQEMVSLLERAGFEIVDHWTFSTFPYIFFMRFRSGFGYEQAFICRQRSGFV